MKEYYEKHVKYIDDICDKHLFELFEHQYLTLPVMKELLARLDKYFPKHITEAIRENLKFNVELGIGVDIDYNSFIKYLYINYCEKLWYKGAIAFDEDTGKVIIFYNADVDNRESTKVTIMCNKNHYTYSVLSRGIGLATFSGEFTPRYDAHYKIENLMNMFE